MAGKIAREQHSTKVLSHCYSQLSKIF